MSENNKSTSDKDKKSKVSLLTIKWAFKVALTINRKVFWFWVLLSVVISILPALALNYNKEIISILSNYLQSGNGKFINVVPSIIILGLILTLTGLFGRINGDLLYMVMYDYYHLGMQDLLMQCVQKVEIKTLMNKEYVDEYRAVMQRAGSLTDFMSSFCLLISKIIGVISLLFIAFKASFLIFIVAIIYISFVVIINMKLADKARLDMVKIRETERKINYFQRLVTVPGVAKEIRIYNMAEDIYDQWDETYKKLDKIEYKRAFWTEMISFLSGLGFYIFIIGMILFCIFQVYSGKMTVDVFLMLYVLGQNISAMITTFSITFQKADRGLFSLERQRNFILNVPKNEKPYNDNCLTVVKNPDVIFEADNVSFSYDDKINVLQDLNFRINKGETIALVGCNGCGKTTLVKLLLTLYKPTKGKLFFMGTPYDDFSKNSISNRIGMFFQNFFLFHASIRENVGFGDIKNVNDDKKVMNAIEKGGASNLLNKMKYGLDQWLQRDVNPEGVMLSGGEKQKVAISRSHMSDKEILIFDEPAAALDPIAEMEQFKIIKNKLLGRTAILISHRVGFARLADRIFVLDNGHIAEIGTHDELMEKDGIYAKFFMQQAEWYDLNDYKTEKQEGKAAYGK